MEIVWDIDKNILERILEGEEVDTKTIITPLRILLDKQEDKWGSSWKGIMAPNEDFCLRVDCLPKWKQHYDIWETFKMDTCILRQIFWLL